MDEKIKLALKNLATNDYQKRGGNFPQSGIPDTIAVFEQRGGVYVRAHFKNTTESGAQQWLERKIRQTVAPGASSTDLSAEFETYQDGDYTNDWVVAAVTIE